MSTIEQIRRTNLATLRDEAGGVRKLSELVDVSESQLSQWINGSKDSKTGRPRGMRPESARRIEKAMGRDPGWLDVPHGDQAPQPAQAPGKDFRELAYELAKSVPGPKKRDTYLTFLRSVDELISQRKRIEESIADIA